MNANERQVGGSHYRQRQPGKPQHWDIVVHCLDGRYLEGCITKYVARHHLKDGKKDLQKAEHYLQKLIEVAREPVLNRTDGVGIPLVYITRDSAQFDMIRDFISDLKEPEALLVKSISEWSTVADLERCRDWLGALILRRYPEGTGTRAVAPR